ncbi:MAG: uracil-DNA glycosylase [Acidobacteria bacterium]|nr:MAG: uracil-DNA glycosylase [Acidobacteriota bacterium]
MKDQLVEHLAFLSELGVSGLSRDPSWRRRAADGPEPEVQETRGQGPESQVARDRLTTSPMEPDRQSQGDQLASGARSTLPAIREDLGDCTRCALHKQGRRQIVFGVGNPNARLMFIGEAPGRDEDIQGIPFVGRAGQLLTKMIEAMGYSRDDVYIANVIKCRPPENRNPEPAEVATCEPFLFRQVESIRPAVIVALGTFAAQALLKTQDPISRLRGRVYKYGGASLIPTFHPAFLLRSPDRKRDAWEDLKKAKAILDDGVEN